MINRNKTVDRKDMKEMLYDDEDEYIILDIYSIVNLDLYRQEEKKILKIKTELS